MDAPERLREQPCIGIIAEAFEQAAAFRVLLTQVQEQDMKTFVDQLSQGTLPAQVSGVNPQELYLWFLKFVKSVLIYGGRPQGASVHGFFDELMAGFRPGSRRCPWLESGLYVNNKGVATGCCMIKDTAQFALGRFGVDSPAELLTRREELRQELLRGAIPRACTGCELARFAVMTRLELVLFALRGLWRRWSPRARWQRRLAASKQRPRVSLPLSP